MAVRELSVASFAVYGAGLGGVAKYIRRIESKTCFSSSPLTFKHRLPGSKSKYSEYSQEGKKNGGAIRFT